MFGSLVPWSGTLSELPPELIARCPFTGALEVRGTLDQLLAATPGPEVMTVASLITSLPAHDVSDDEWVDLSRVINRCKAWLDSLEAVCCSELARNNPRGTGRARYDDADRREDIT